jgi:hypothetical protein
LSGSSKNRTSEQPAESRAERELFVRNVLHKGVALTESLIQENQAFEQQVRQLQEDNRRLRAQLASNDTMRELLATIDTLEQERRSLLHHSSELESEFAQHNERQVEIELELNRLASLYVASFQLSATLSLGRVVRHMCELLEQLVGAQSFLIYVVSPDGARATPIGGRGQGHGPAPTAVSTEDGPMGDVCLTGVARILDPLQPRAATEPLAVLPLVFDTEVIGLITISSLLSHKREWARVDHELFKLLSVHGATALISSTLYAKEAGPRAALHDVLFHLERERLRLLTEPDPDAGGDL